MDGEYLTGLWGEGEFISPEEEKEMEKIRYARLDADGTSQTSQAVRQSGDCGQVTREPPPAFLFLHPPIPDSRPTASIAGVYPRMLLDPSPSPNPSLPIMSLSPPFGHYYPKVVAAV